MSVLFTPFDSHILKTLQGKVSVVSYLLKKTQLYIRKSQNTSPCFPAQRPF